MQGEEHSARFYPHRQQQLDSAPPIFQLKQSLSSSNELPCEETSSLSRLLRRPPRGHFEAFRGGDSRAITNLKKQRAKFVPGPQG